jgi:hypothetical protein
MINITLYKEIFQSLSMIESTICDNEDSFIKTFVKFTDPLFFGVTNIYFGSETVKFNYVLMCGQHVSDSIKLEEFVEWLETLE